MKAISEMPPPTDRKGVERILGTLNYVAKFVPDMSRITQPIRELLKQDTQFIWEYEQEAAFEHDYQLLLYLLSLMCKKRSQLAAMRHSQALVQCCYRKDGPLPMYLAHSQVLRQDMRK